LLFIQKYKLITENTDKKALSYLSFSKLTPFDLKILRKIIKVVFQQIALALIAAASFFWLF
jgi:hypothetical protein